jgi:hypothetical protein
MSPTMNEQNGLHSTLGWSTLNTQSPKNKDKNLKNQMRFDSELHVKQIVDQTLKNIEFDRDYYS